MAKRQNPGLSRHVDSSGDYDACEREGARAENAPPSALQRPASTNASHTLQDGRRALSAASASRVYASRASQKPFRGTVAQRGRERHRNARAAPPKREARQRLQTQCKLSTRPLRARSNAARSATRTHCTSPRITRRRALAPRAPPPCTNEGGSAASAAQAGHHAARKVLSHLPVVLIALSPLLADDARVHRAELPHRDSWEGRQGGACAQGARRLRTGLFCQFFF